MLLFPCVQNEPLAKYTSYRIGGPAQFMAFPKSKADIFAIGAYVREKNLPYFILGSGSNILAPDEGFAGVVICTRELPSLIEFKGELVRASASTLNARLLRACAEKGLGGIEFLSGVPGNLGGAVFMNAGTASGWIDRVLEEVEVVGLRGGERKISKSDLHYSYREQHFLKPGEIIFSAMLRLQKDGTDSVKSRLVDAVKKRKAAQPIELPSCGSVFRNPPGENAWKLIAGVGLRGQAQGGARFSEKHCNFIVNEGGASKEDVLLLIQEAKKRVKEKYGIDLQQEVIVMESKYL